MGRVGPVVIVVVALVLSDCAARAPGPVATSKPQCRCAPGEPCWPSADEWQRLAASLHGSLQRPTTEADACRADPSVCSEASRLDPFALQDRAGATQSRGWLDAWDSAPSAYAVAAADASDVAAAVDFARRHGLRLVVKGTGHDYLGRSSAPDSLLVWTHAMRRVEVEDGFVPRGCASAAPAPAVSVGAGARWLEVYQEVTNRHGRYVQGGGCTSVGAAGGFLQGGGFGSWSRRFGVAAASLLEAEVVTADGEVRVVNACRDPDLFWALRGGGGGTFGVVTRVTLRTHPLPATFGVARGRITATDDGAFRELLERFVVFAGRTLATDRWGEQVRVGGDRTLEVSLAFSGMSASEAEAEWQPMRDFVARRPEAYSMQLKCFEAPGAHLWDAGFLAEHAPGAIATDPRPGQPPDRFWWAGDADQVSAYWYAYQSRWLPSALFDPTRAGALAAALLEASRHWSFSLHFNKAQAGASPETVRAGRETSMNPVVFDAAALVIMGAAADRGVEPDRSRGEAQRAAVATAMKPIRDLTPGSGSYPNETDWFEPDWQSSLWGASYDRLLAIKTRYDPDGLFVCHHCVGSEAWSPDGRCRARP